MRISDWSSDVCSSDLSALLAPSRSFAELTAEIYGIAAPTVVYNGWKAPPASGIERQPNMIFTAGRLWDEAKGMAVLAGAAEQMWLPVHAAGPSRGPGGESIDQIGRAQV